MNLQQSIRKILREETRPLKVLRRTHLIDSLIETMVERYYSDNWICVRYDDDKMYLKVIQEAIIETLYFNTFYIIDDTSEEWGNIYKFVYEYIDSKFGEKLKSFFNEKCTQKLEIDEAELTEKCWAGYTQKGMKTMFGKRYPNCVKKKK